MPKLSVRVVAAFSNGASVNQACGAGDITLATRANVWKDDQNNRACEACDISYAACFTRSNYFVTCYPTFRYAAHGAKGIASAPPILEVACLAAEQRHIVAPGEAKRSLG